MTDKRVKYGKKMQGQLFRMTHKENSSSPDLGVGGGSVVKRGNLERILFRELAGKTEKGCDSCVRFGDSMYYLPKVGEVEALLNANDVNEDPLYVAERFDCDDFAYVIKGAASLYFYKFGAVEAGFCLGIIWGRFKWVGNEYHAVNWFIDADKEKLWFIEPQSDGIFDSSKCTGGVDTLLV